MYGSSTTKKLFEYTLMCAKESGFTNNIYFSSNPLKRYFVRTNLIKIISSVQRLTNKNDVLDFGPGFGMLLPALSKIFTRTVALDVDKNQLTSAAKIIKNFSIPNVKLVYRSLEVEFDDFDDESFDCIVVDNVLEHISYHDEILQNFHRILRMNGLLVISLPTENVLYRLLENKNDGHVLRSSKEIHSLLGRISKDFIGMGSLNTPPIYLIQLFSKSAEV